MQTVKRSDTRGRGEHGWLSSRHSFSFAEYYDPENMGFRALRVINEDWIAGGGGFPTHPHKDMEIITYVVEGALEHKDSMGNSTAILPGEVQRMSAGTGIRHSEFNHFADRKTHLLQIWILPRQSGLPTGYGQKSFEEALNKQKLVLTVSPDGRDGSIAIQQDASLYVSRLPKGEFLDFVIPPGRHAWLQLVKGSLKSENAQLEAGDALVCSEEPLLKLQAAQASEFLIFDLA